METEKESKIAFLDMSVSREPDGRLTTSVLENQLTLISTWRMIRTTLNQ